MKTFLEIFSFGWPYIRRYKFRFFIGICFGILFGLTNGSFIIASKTLFDRLTRPPEALHMVGDILKSSVSSPYQMQLQTWKAVILKMLDPWLPLVGRAMDWKQSLGALLLLPLLVSLRGATNYISAYCMAWVSERATSDVRIDLLSKFTELSLNYFNRSSTGDLTTRVHRDTQMLARCFQQGFSDLITEPFTILSVFAALLFLDWKLALISTVFLPLCIIPIVILAKKARKASRKASDAGVAQANLLVEMLSNMRIIKAFGLEAEQSRRFRKQSHDLMRHNLRGTQSKELINPIIEAISMLGVGIIILYICWSQRSISDLAGFLMGMVLFYVPVKRIAAFHIIFKQTHVAIERLRDTLREEPTVVEALRPLPKKEFYNNIEFRDVSFSYDQAIVLDRFNLTIPRGQRLGIVGESGAGKSTIVNLLFRFYDPTGGSIFLDGIDFKKIALADLRSLMALVSQETILFNETVAENIGSGKQSATQQEIEIAARLAGAHGFIMNLPQSYQTLIGERGVKLSGGQRQRLAIARAFIRNAPILVLDEATASLDSKTEQEIQLSLEELSQERTVICVAHRLSTLRLCEAILVLHQGRIVEHGSYSYLLQKGGLFTTLAQKQGLV